MEAVISYKKEEKEGLKAFKHYSDYNLIRRVRFQNEQINIISFCIDTLNLKNDKIWNVPKYSNDLLIEDELFTFPFELEDIKNVIDSSRYILELEKCWDDDSALPISKEIWSATAKFLANYSKYLFNIFSVVIDSPEINPCSNNSIDLSWRTNKSRMLINIRKEENEISAFYYGDLYEKRSPIKGIIPVKDIEGFFANWMRNLAK